MATASEVDAGLDDISALIRAKRQKLLSCQQAVAAAYAELLDIPTTFEDVITTVNGYTPSGAFELHAQAKVAALQTEFIALRNKAQTASNALNAIDFAT